MKKIKEKEEPEINNNEEPEAEPEPSGEIPPLPTAELEADIKELERKQGLLEVAVESIRHTNSFVLLILALGFITMFVGFITLLIVTFRSNIETQTESIKSIQDLKNDVNNLESVYSPMLESTSSAQ